MTQLSIVLPCYNEGENLLNVVKDYQLCCQNREEVELILVDNGSQDETPQLLKKLLDDPHPFKLKVVTVAQNKGLGDGVMRGMQQAEGTYVAWSHADLQTPAKDVFALYDRLQQEPNAEHCFGKGFRTNDRGGDGLMTRLHTLCSRVILGYQMYEIYAQPKLFHRSFLDELKSHPEGFELDTFAFYKAMILKRPIIVVPVHFLARQAGESKWSTTSLSRLRFMARNFFYLIELRLRRLSGRL
ncbi:glycosyltransferase family 2 protein [Magnetococcus sp. PR-3]|uniref:glycosyltransferase family 2 protein n=1 Tax=Magnetococcus sp. PR-3 TaxID=3120355 RepID=UPI002FCE359D